MSYRITIELRRDDTYQPIHTTAINFDGDEASARMIVSFAHGVAVKCQEAMELGAEIVAKAQKEA
jgi:hypothetical protein